MSSTEKGGQGVDPDKAKKDKEELEEIRAGGGGLYPNIDHRDAPKPKDKPEEEEA